MTYQHFEINVALNGRHYFATHERSITSAEKCVEIATELEKRFPVSDGFHISISGQVAYGHQLDINGVLDYIRTGNI